jgi:hypothetical protein
MRGIDGLGVCVEGLWMRGLELTSGKSELTSNKFELASNKCQLVRSNFHNFFQQIKKISRLPYFLT